MTDLNMSQTTLAYVAGVFDGEGSVVIGLSKRQRKYGVVPNHWLQVGITNTNRELIEWLQLVFGGHISDNSHSPSRKHQRPCWAWRIMSKQAQTFLESIHPYLRVKRTHAELAIDFQKKSTSTASINGNVKITLETIAERDWYKREISKLNLSYGTLRERLVRLWKP